MVIDTGDVYQEVSTIISILPGVSEDNYAEPDSLQIERWNSILDDLLASNFDQVVDSANVFNYDLIQFYDTTANGSTNYYILKSIGSNYWGTYIYNPNYCRSLIIQSPHPKKDFNTGKEGIHIFRSAQALFFCLSGTDRCNSLSFSSCTGKTSVCSDSLEDYRLSDLAHNVNSIFQVTTDVLLNHYEDAHFIQLHGFHKEESDPYIILSNGTQLTPNPDYISILKDNLLLEDDSLTFKIAHIDLNWDRLRGFTNTQGRLINSSPDFCNSNAIMSDGKFIHMEQEKHRLRLDLSGWEKVSNAIMNTFDCLTLDIEQRSFKIEMQKTGKVKIEWESIIGNIYNEYEVERSKNGQDWEVIYSINDSNNYEEKKTYSTLDEDPHIGISYYRLKRVDNDNLSNYSQTEILDNTRSALTIFPNPSNDIITIDHSSFSYNKFTILNIFGEDQVGKYELVNKSKTNSIIDISKLPIGIYYFKTEKGVINKFLKI